PGTHSSPLSTFFPYTTLFRSNRNLFGLWPFEPKHTGNFAMRGHTIRAEVCRRAHQKNIFFLSACQRAILEQDRRHQLNCPYASADRKSTRLNSSHLGISYAVF